MDGNPRDNNPGRDVACGRLSAEDYARNFADVHPPLTAHESVVEADRCYFCHDAPCMHACPTGIDIAMFIRQIQAGNPVGAAETILEDNVFGGMCARVCPTETLCEEACVRMTAEERPVKIGLLQRHATDRLFEDGRQVFRQGAATGKRVAVVGAGPAGLSCAHKLATLGHAVTVFEAQDKPGGLNEYGIAAYKTVDNFAQREVDYILAVGGIEIEYGRRLGRDIRLEDLRRDYDAVFLGIGLGAVNALGIEGDDVEGAEDAVDFIAELRQTPDLSTLPVGRRIVVIGGGMTAIDVAVQSRLLGAEDVTIVYRRGKEHMNASIYEQQLAQTNGVRIKHWAKPIRIVSEAGEVRGVEFEYTRAGADGRLEGTGERFVLEADVVFRAIGQTFVAGDLDGAALELSGGRIRVDEDRRTSLPDVFAGGDCIAGGQDLTVAAVEDGKVAALAIDRALCAAGATGRHQEAQAGRRDHG
jgi:dihydropyrimidine dehydrogenase (NAD+) subunit PreT